MGKVIMAEVAETLAQKTIKKTLTVKQLEAQVIKVEKDKERIKANLLKRIELTKQKEESIKNRKTRNKKIYDWGGLLPSVLGVEFFDKIANNADVKNVLRGVLLKMKDQFDRVGFGVTEDNKPRWLEFFKNEGKKFLDDLETKKLESKKNAG